MSNIRVQQTEAIYEAARALSPGLAANPTALLRCALQMDFPAHAHVAEFLKAGADPFMTDARGIPVFLELNARKETPGVEFALIVQAMMRTLKAQERKLMEAHCACITEALGRGEAYGVILAFRKVWALAHRWENIGGAAPKRKGKVPAQVTLFLSPLTNATAAPKLMATLAHYDIDDLEDNNALSVPKAGALDNLVRDFIRHVVLAECLMDYCKTTATPLNEKFLSLFNEKTSSDNTPLIPSLIRALTPIVKIHLFKERSIDKIIGMVLAGYPRVRFPDTLMAEKAVGEWHSLTQEKDHVIRFKDPPVTLTVHTLTNRDEMLHEADIMTHCIGDHILSCLMGEEHFFSIRKEGEALPLSTFGIKWNHERGAFLIFDHEGPGEPEKPIPCLESMMAAREFIDELNIGRIKKSPHLGETLRSRKKNDRRPDILRTIGYELTPENSNNAFRDFCDNKMRRGLEYNPESGAFDIRSNSTEVITGSYNTTATNSDGKSVAVSIGYRKLKCNVWFNISGLRDKTMPVVCAFMEKLQASKKASATLSLRFSGSYRAKVQSYRKFRRRITALVRSFLRPAPDSMP